MNEKKKVLFICVHNSGRSQMAEAFLDLLAGDRFQTESAGLAPQNLNPHVIAVMKEIGIDLSKNKADSVFDFYKEGRLYDYVITVCDDAVENQCPIFPGIAKRLHWPFPDPGKITGTEAEKLERVRQIRDNIKNKINSWMETLNTS